ncbi:thioredoxin domain-containing protein, partial [bacterium]|nr:thioredoxin domain-containing protein [bacterium]
MKNSKKTPNRLIHEKSPYLLQHAHNLVHWFPWGPEAFQKAQKENKPVFLSIGYSTCHWCHVMEKESFQDEEVAGMMNETFVSIKVDREERPDIDSVYMDVCQVLTGTGGWPLTLILTPEKKPFFAATYIPKEGRLGMMGLKELISRIQEMWNLNQEEIRRSSQQIVSSLKEMTQKTPGEGLGKGTLDKAFQELANRYDSKHGGFGKAPKFPAPHNLLFLLRYWKRTQNPYALAMVEKTLQSMRQGGMFDHVGYGFHRYSTDEKWQVPHFEKMLYDQALLAFAYTEAYQATGKEFYKNTAEEILEYVLRDMTSPEGGFYSAEDADTEGEEGKFYIWTWKELNEILNREEMDWTYRVYNIYKEGNFPQEAAEQEGGKNILYLKKPLKETAQEGNVKPGELKSKVEKIRSKLFNAREERIHPLKDDKILTDWNGLMIASLSKAAQVFDKSEYLHAAQKAAGFLSARLWGEKGALFHRYRKGEAEIPGFLDDYAFLIWGLLELYEASLEAGYLQQALKLSHYLLSHFWDEKEGGFGLTSSSQESFFIQPKNIYDGALPSGNSV